MNQLQPNPGTWKDKKEFPFMSEQGVRGTAGYQVTYYTANQAQAEFEKLVSHYDSHCWNCGSEHDNNVEKCPKCGRDLIPF